MAKRKGRVVVMSQSISEAQLDAETERQAGVIFPLIRERMRGDERRLLDYGCGAGRFTGHLANLLPVGGDKSRFVMGYDPCLELLELAPASAGIVWDRSAPAAFFERWQNTFDLTFTAMVLGSPLLDISETVKGLVGVTTKGGMICAVDHMTDEQPTGKWWRFRPDYFYINLFASYGVMLEKVGDDRQLSNPVSILVGRRV
jgi:SAM-dependent methyltransferase